MIKVATKFIENIWDKEANAEIPFELAYVGEALSVSAQKKGLAIEQKFNGRTCGMFFKYKDLTSLFIDDAVVEDFKDLDNVESAVAAAMAVKKLTILGNRFEIYEDAAGTTAVDFSEDINITDEFNNAAPLNWYIKPVKGYQIQMIESENAVVETGKINKDGLYPFTVKGIAGNVLIQVTIVYTGSEVVLKSIAVSKLTEGTTSTEETWDSTDGLLDADWYATKYDSSSDAETAATSAVSAKSADSITYAAKTISTDTVTETVDGEDVTKYVVTGIVVTKTAPNAPEDITWTAETAGLSEGLFTDVYETEGSALDAANAEASKQSGEGVTYTVKSIVTEAPKPVEEEVEEEPEADPNT